MYRLKHVYTEAVLLILYQSIIYAHFNYSSLHVVEAQRLTPITPIIAFTLKESIKDYCKSEETIAYSEPICKSLGLLKVSDMLKFALWKLYSKLMNKIVNLISHLAITNPLSSAYKNYRSVIDADGELNHSN